MHYGIPPLTILLDILVQGQYFIQANIHFASLCQHKIWRTNKEFSVPWFHTFAWPFSGPNSEVEELPTCYVIILKNIPELLLKQCMHACLLGFQRAIGALSHTLLDFCPFWTTHKVHCLTLTQEDELIDCYIVSSLFKTVRSGSIRTTMSTLPKVAITFECALWEWPGDMVDR